MGQSNLPEATWYLFSSIQLKTSLWQKHSHSDAPPSSPRLHDAFYLTCLDGCLLTQSFPWTPSNIAIQIELGSVPSYYGFCNAIFPRWSLLETYSQLIVFINGTYNPSTSTEWTSRIAASMDHVLWRYSHWNWRPWLQWLHHSYWLSWKMNNLRWGMSLVSCLNSIGTWVMLCPRRCQFQINGISVFGPLFVTQAPPGSPVVALLPQSVFPTWIEGKPITVGAQDILDIPTRSLSSNLFSDGKTPSGAPYSLACVLHESLFPVHIQDHSLRQTYRQILLWALTTTWRKLDRSPRTWTFC